MGGCPFAHDAVTYAVTTCPFLKSVARDQGEDYARNIAVAPARPAAGAPAPVLAESLDGVTATFELFHGQRGVVPLSSSAFGASVAGESFVGAVELSGLNNVTTFDLLKLT